MVINAESLLHSKYTDWYHTDSTYSNKHFMVLNSIYTNGKMNYSSMKDQILTISPYTR